MQSLITTALTVKAPTALTLLLMLGMPPFPNWKFRADEMMT
jgi:hypothetical protein